MDMAPGHFLVPAGCRNRDFLSPESPFRWRRRYGCFSGFILDDLGFSPQGILIGAGGKVGGGPGGPHPLWARPMVGPRPPRGGHPGVLLRLVFDFPYRSGKNMNFGFCPVQFREYSFFSFLNPKTAENRQLALWHLVNRLVPESV